MEKFKPVNLVNYNEELSIHIYVNYLREYIAKVNQIECDFKDYVFDDDLVLKRKIEYFSPSYKI